MGTINSTKHAESFFSRLFYYQIVFIFHRWYCSVFLLLFLFYVNERFFLFLFLLPVYQYRIKFRSLLEAHFSMIDVAFDQHYDISVRKLWVSYKMTPINMMLCLVGIQQKKLTSSITSVGLFVVFFSEKFEI